MLNKDREKLLSLGKSQEDKLFLAKILDKIALCQKTFQTQTSDFLDPLRQQLAEALAAHVPEVEYLMSGGYPQAERQRLVIFPEFLTVEDVDDQIDCLVVEGNFRFQKVTHRDYLGSILGLGLKREKIGDIIVLEEGAQLLADRDVADYLVLNLTKIHRVPVQVRIILRNELVLPEGQTREIKATVASLRIDAIAAAGFSTSRSQMVREITAEKLKLNWQPVPDPSFPVREGDILSLRGRGRVEVTQIGGNTKKGRISLVLNKYL